MHPLPVEMSEAVFKELYEVIFQHLVTFFRLKGCDPEQSRDLAQETLLYVWAKIHKKEWESVFTGALFNKALNLWRDYCRKRARHGEVELNETLSLHIAEDPGNDTEYWDWLNKLDVAEEKTILHLRFAEDLTRKEIAEILKIHPSSVNRHEDAALRKLRACYEGVNV